MSVQLKPQLGKRTEAQPPLRTQPEIKRQSIEDPIRPSTEELQIHLVLLTEQWTQYMQLARHSSIQLADKLAINALRTYFIVANEVLEGRAIHLGRKGQLCQDELVVALGETEALLQTHRIKDRKEITLTLDPAFSASLDRMAKRFGLSHASFLANALSIYRTLKCASLEGEEIYVVENGRAVGQLEIP